MSEPLPGPSHHPELDRFPPALKALVEAELRAGNRIIEAGGGHPAPPAGALVKLEHDLLTWPAAGQAGLRLRIRDSSAHHQEVTDSDAFFWVLTAAGPPSHYPDMDAIRRAHHHPAPPIIDRTYPPGSVEMDVRGETLIYHEVDRRAYIRWFGSFVERSSLTTWWYGVGGRQQTMTAEERTLTLERLLAYARVHINADLQVRD